MVSQRGRQDLPLLPCSQPSDTTLSGILYAQCHDAVDNIVVILLQRLDGLLAAHACLGHHELDVLGLETGVVHLLTIVLLLLSRLLVLDGFALVGAVGGVVVTGVRIVCRLCGKLLGGRGLSLGVEVLNLGFAEDAVVRPSAQRPPSISAPQLD